jgi:hypothetical protein
MPKQPLWATPARQRHLVKMFNSSRGFCVYHHPRCEDPEHNYGVWIESTIAMWKAEDREERSYLNKLDSNRLDGTFGLQGARFDAIARDQWHQVAPAYYTVKEGLNPITMHRVVQIRIPSTYINLFVDVNNLPDKVGKWARKKALARGTPLPQTVHDACMAAVRRFWLGSKF